MNKANILIVGLLVFLGLITFYNSFDNDFLMDDFPMLVGNLSIGAPDFLQLDPSAKSQVYFRPVTHFLNLITFSLFGTNPIGYHAVNLLLLIAAAFAMYLLIESAFSNRRVAFWTSVFLIIHPINTVCVNYKNATADAFLVLALTMALIHGFKNEDFSDRVLSLVWLTLAVLCHEIALAYPLYLGALLFVTRKYSFSQTIRVVLVSTCFLAVYFVFRLQFASLQGVFHRSFDLVSFSQIVFWYLAKLFTMKDIVLIWNVPSREDGLIWIYGFILLMIFLLGVFVSLRRRNPPAALGLLWFVIGFFPVIFACFSRPWFGVIVEPFWLIVSSIGFFLFIVSVIDQAFNKKTGIVAAAFIVLTATMLPAAWRYNDLWGNAVRYCEYWRQISPQNFFPRFWLAYSLMEKKDYSKARSELQFLIQGGLHYEWTYGNLGIAEYYLKNYNDAENAFKAALKFNSRRGDTHYYLGLIYSATGDFVRAQKAFRNAITYSPEIVDAKNRLDNLLTRVPPQDH